MTDRIIHLQSYASPAGELLLGSFEGRLCLCDWAQSPHRVRTDCGLCSALRSEFVRSSSPLIEQTRRQLDLYFAGALTTFSLPLMPVGSDFRQRVWLSLLHIPYGTTVSYAQVARAIGAPCAVRAVAGAIGANPLSIVVPCHRVVGADGSLTGYAGGLAAKRILLSLERG